MAIAELTLPGKLVMSKKVSAFLAFCSLIGLVVLMMIWAKFSAVLVSHPATSGYFMLSALFFGVIVYHAMMHPGMLSKIMSSTPLRFLGKISYSFYLIHILTLQFIPHLFPKISSVSGVVGVYFFIFTLCVFLSSLNYLYFERPYFNGGLLSFFRMKRG
ncbi:hypothetical protein PQR63_12075 [Herbaspirillum rhizosphaerae]|uniref:Acyltransferase-like protein n=1 Tax=Herbaspirillum rhizosphaerae TaxID=346179 RepID=A0ABW8Z844_9BURK